MRARLELDASTALLAPDGKRRYNELHFAAAAARYDFATRAMSLGRDAAWKRALVAALPRLSAPVCVDVACGTGDLAFLLAERYPEGTIVGIDIAEPMLAQARRRNRRPNVRFRLGEMSVTGMPADSADLVTGGYALRNAPDLDAALSEIRRVLKPGGTAAFLDFAKPSTRRLQSPQRWLLRGWCGLWGLLLHGNPEIHGYIALSLKGFPDRTRFRELLAARGFEVVMFRPFFLGITELTVVRRPPTA